jgi:outer membrane protein
MQPVKKHLLIAAVAVLAPQLALSESLVDIYESALTNDPVLKAARASFNADR